MTAVAFERVAPRRARRPRTGWRDPLGVLGALMIAAGMLLLGMPVYVTVADMPTRQAAVRQATGRLDEAGLERAAEYDRSLLGGASLAVGEAADPFSGNGQPAYETDQDYQSQLGSGANMAVIRIPRIGLELPVGHGTGTGTLETQAGHVYGTTLPVGDPGNSVIAGHRGLGTRLLFYRLGELAPGDMVYTAAEGRTVAWRVSELVRADPGSMEETALISAGDGTETTLTLYTCDPPGLNTRRLIVRAERVPYVDAESIEGQWDPWRAWITLGAATPLALLAVRLASRRRQPIRHANGLRREGGREYRPAAHPRP